MGLPKTHVPLTSCFAPPKLAIPWAAKIGAKVWPADASADAALATIQFPDRPNVVVFLVAVRYQSIISGRLC